jgi:hypothetical protein
VGSLKKRGRAVRVPALLLELANRHAQRLVRAVDRKRRCLLAGSAEKPRDRANAKELRPHLTAGTRIAPACEQSSQPARVSAREQGVSK